MKKTFLALGCALLLIGCATDNSLDYSEMDAYPSNDYETTGSDSLPTLGNQPIPQGTYVYTPTSKARTKSKIVIKKTGKALPTLSAPASVKTTTKSLPNLTAPVPVKKSAKSLPILDTGTLSKIKSKPLSSPKKAAKSTKSSKPAHCTVVKYKYITKVVTKKPSKATSTKSKKTSKSKSKKK